MNSNDDGTKHQIKLRSMMDKIKRDKKKTKCIPFWKPDNDWNGIIDDYGLWFVILVCASFLTGQDFVVPFFFTNFSIVLLLYTTKPYRNVLICECVWVYLFFFQNFTMIHHYYFHCSFKMVIVVFFFLKYPPNFQKK